MARGIVVVPPQTKTDQHGKSPMRYARICAVVIVALVAICLATCWALLNGVGDASKYAASSASTAIAGPTDSTTSAGLADSTDSVATTDSSASTAHTDPAASTSPADSTTPADSADPADPAASAASAAATTAAGRTYDINVNISDIPTYAGKPSVEINGNHPFFTDDDLDAGPFETYSELDNLGRCGQAYALVGDETMPRTKRRSIGMIKPSGWHLSEYEWVEGRHLFNRCHLIAFSLAGENDNPQNLITGTRTMNALGMLPYEEETVAYIDQTGNHVLYRVTPMFDGDNLVASGVLMEAKSVEDDGDGIQFCVWCYNVEPGVVIDYATGDNRAGDPLTERYADNARDQSSESGTDKPSSSSQSETDRSPSETGNTHDENATSSSDSQPRESHADSRDPNDRPGSAAAASGAGAAGGVGKSSNAADPNTDPKTTDEHAHAYVLNVNTHRFHRPDCPSVATIKEKNKRETEATKSELIDQGFKPCGVCNP